MAHSLSAKKRIRQNAKQRMRNRARISSVRTQIKKVLTLPPTPESAETLDKEVRVAQKKLDQLTAKGNIHKNTAARKKSQLMKLANAAKTKSN